MKVLLIDDSPDALAIAKARLRKDDLDVICADNGQSGLVVAGEEKPDLILLDVDMPEMSGFDVCKKLKENADLQMIPVIFLTGSTDIDDKVKGLDLGAVDYVTKPFDAFELRARVRAALRTKRLQDLLVEHARIDPLTGLWNRRALTDRLDQEFAKIRRNGGSVAFVMADIDHFKRVNDAYGHRIGDEIISRVAEALHEQSRQSDLPVRYGGEEFSVLLPDESIESAAALAERCRKDIEEICVGFAGQEVRVTVSFGVSDTNIADSPEALIESADAALYQAKNSGRNCVVSAGAEVERTTG